MSKNSNAGQLASGLTLINYNEATATWIHEIGHLLGLKHNPSATSIMFFIDVDISSKLDSQDLRAIASLHALRPIGVLEMSSGLLQ
jgi:predicted Zn-dependent protease